MVTYGPWIEVPDRDLDPGPSRAFWRTIPGSDGGWTQTPDFEDPDLGFEPDSYVGIKQTDLHWEGDEIIVDLPHINHYWKSDAADILHATHGSDAGVPPFPMFSAQHSNTRGLAGSNPADPTDPTPWFDSHAFERGVSAQLYYTTVDSLLWDDAWRASLPPEEQWPEGATGYEVEERELAGEMRPAAVILGAEVHVSGTGLVQDGEMFPLELLITFRDKWLPEGVFTLDDAAFVADGDDSFGQYRHGINNPDPAVREYPIDDVTFVTIGSDHEPVGPGLLAPLSLWSCLRIPIEAEEFFGSHDDGYVPLGSTTAIFQAAEDPSPVTYKIRPPRIRWIYGEPTPPTPYRRIVLRGGDGLAGGARRVGQRPKTIQGSNRRGGGAIV